MSIYRCSNCNKFISYEGLDNCVRYTFYGSCTDQEPPDESFLHLKCWDKMPGAEKELTKKASWQKPMYKGKAL